MNSSNIIMMRMRVTIDKAREMEGGREGGRERVCV